MDRARYAVDAVVVEGRSLRSVASSLGMSKSWVAKQVRPFQGGGYEALAPKSTAPHRPSDAARVALENEIVTMRKHLDEEGLDAGPLTIQYHLRQRPGTAPGGRRSTARWSGRGGRPPGRSAPDLLVPVRGEDARTKPGRRT